MTAVRIKDAMYFVTWGADGEVSRVVKRLFSKKHQKLVDSYYWKKGQPMPALLIKIIYAAKRKRDHEQTLGAVPSVRTGDLGHIQRAGRKKRRWVALRCL